MKKKFFMFLAFGLAAVSMLYWINVSAAAGPSSDDWWDSEWHYRIRVDVSSGRYLRQDEPVEFGAVFTLMERDQVFAGGRDVDADRPVDATGGAAAVALGTGPLPARSAPLDARAGGG